MMVDRKKQHIEEALKPTALPLFHDHRFYYEPLIAAHPILEENTLSTPFVGKMMRAPLWISSMTGGTEKAYTLNQRLGEVTAELGLGMGLGSCRPLLDGKARLKDFDLRGIIGESYPLWANLGIAQIEKLLQKDDLSAVIDIIKILKADGLIIHINPIQEWIQLEGDKFKISPLETLQNFLPLFPYPVMVKEVGQGFGPQSLSSLLQLPLVAIDFAGLGGTNFSAIEIARYKESGKGVHGQSYSPLVNVGHSCEEMIGYIHHAKQMLINRKTVNQFILSGGIKDFLDGHYLMSKLELPSLYGQGRALLYWANRSYEELKSYLQGQIRGLQFARQFLSIKRD